MTDGCMPKDTLIGQLANGDKRKWIFKATIRRYVQVRHENMVNKHDKLGGKGFSL